MRRNSSEGHKSAAGPWAGAVPTQPSLPFSLSPTSCQFQQDMHPHCLHDGFISCSPLRRPCQIQLFQGSGLPHLAVFTVPLSPSPYAALWLNCKPRKDTDPTALNNSSIGQVTFPGLTFNTCKSGGWEGSTKTMIWVWSQQLPVSQLYHLLLWNFGHVSSSFCALAASAVKSGLW